MKKQIERILKNTASQKGFILILALVAMLAMTIIGISLIMNMSTDFQLARNEREGKQAFQLAEAGINESIARLRLPAANESYVGEPEGVMGDYRDPGGWGGTSFSPTTVPPSAEGLKYTADISYLTEGDDAAYCDSAANSVALLKNTVGGVPAADSLTCNDEVVMYGQDFNICFTNLPCLKPSAKKGVYPVYKITSTGTVNTTERVIEAYVGASNINIDTEGAINTNQCFNAGGSPDIQGPVVEGGGAACLPCAAGADSCPTTAKPADDMTKFLTGDDIATLGAQADVNIACITKNACNADIGALADADWGDCAGDTSSKFIYIDTGFVDPEPGISAADLPGGCGRGILVVNGNISISGNARWEGLIYVMGKLTIDGTVSVTGGIMANQSVLQNGGGNGIILYDKKTLEEVGRQAGSSAKTYISWRRL